MWIKIINMLPRKISLFVIIMLLKYVDFRINLCDFVKKLWLLYYLNMLQKTKNYYKTLSALNTNKFVPSDLNILFIDEAQIKFSQLVHS